MKIFLTGSSGMVGQNIIESNFSKEYEFLKPSSSELNLLDYESVNNYLRNKRPDMVIHSAGVVGGIQSNINNPVKFLYENLQMGLNLIMACKLNKITKLMNFSSSCVYPRNSINPISENEILNGKLEPTNEGYAIAKISNSKLCQYINKEDKKFSYKTVIPCNLYGKFDNFDLESSHLIPAVIKKICDAKKANLKSVDVWGDGLSRREFMYAGDFANFVFFAIDNFERMPEIMNVGIGRDYSVKDYYKKIANIIDYSGSFRFDLSKPAGMKQKLVDISKLKNFGWQHQTKLDDGLRITCNYYLNEDKNEK